MAMREILACSRPTSTSAWSGLCLLREKCLTAGLDSLTPAQNVVASCSTSHRASPGTTDPTKLVLAQTITPALIVLVVPSELKTTRPQLTLSLEGARPLSAAACDTRNPSCRQLNFTPVPRRRAGLSR